MTSPRDLDTPQDPSRPFDRPHVGAAEVAPGAPAAPAPHGVPASSVSAPEPRRGRLLSTVLAGAVAGAAVAAPITLLLGERPAPAPIPAAMAPEAEASPVSSPSGIGLDVAAVLDIARPAVVAIRTQVVSPTSAGLQRGEGAGSGFVIDPAGTIVTNSHVVAGARSISVELADGTELDADLVAQDPGRDLAVLSVDGGDLPALEIGDSTGLGVGDPVVAIGNALGLDGDLTVTSGIVSAKDRDVPVTREITLRGTIQTDAAINPGNSGGPLVDAQGRVVGINSAGALGAQSVGFAIPIDDAMPVLESLARGEVPAQPFLGVQTADLTDAVRAESGVDREDGALVVDVTAGSGAEDAGIRPGDVIVGVDGRDIETSADLGDAVIEAGAGAEVEIEVDRGGRSVAVIATVGARPGSVA
jgi:serine protease Do